LEAWLLIVSEGDSEEYPRYKFEYTVKRRVGG
jgi:hypothetical protein